MNEEAARLLEAQKTYYDLRAPDYMDLAKPSDRPGRGLLRDDEAAALVDELHPHGDVLELACGPGAFTRHLVRHATSATAVDASSRMLEARGLGSCRTTFHLNYEREVAALLGIPSDVVQVALLPVAHTIGTDFRPAHRPPPEAIVSWDRWGSQRRVTGRDVAFDVARPDWSASRYDGVSNRSGAVDEHRGDGVGDP